MNHYRPILATLGYVFNPAGTHVLMMHRSKRPGDPHLGKYNGLGGKLNANEDIVAGMKRELREEAGIEATKLSIAGTISWPGFGKVGEEDWFGFIFRITKFEGEPKKEDDEGTLSWVAIDEVPNLPLWPGDRHFLPLVLGAEPTPFHGVMPYEDGQPVSWTCTRLG